MTQFALLCEDQDASLNARERRKSLIGFMHFDLNAVNTNIPVNIDADPY
jgi:hypothetical protein